MPAVKTTTAVKKVPTKKTTKAQVNIFGPPACTDAKALAAVKAFEKTAQALTKEAAKTLRDYHAGNLQSVPSAYDPFNFAHTIYPVLRLASFAKYQWEVLQAMQTHTVDPTKRNENTLRKRIDVLLDFLDETEAAPLYDAIHVALNEREKRKAWSAYEAVQREQRRKRLDMTPADFAKLLKKEQAQYREEQVKLKAKYAELAADEAAEAAKAAKAKKSGKALA